MSRHSVTRVGFVNGIHSSTQPVHATNGVHGFLVVFLAFPPVFFFGLLTPDLQRKDVYCTLKTETARSLAVTSGAPVKLRPVFRTVPEKRAQWTTLSMAVERHVPSRAEV